MLEISFSFDNAVVNATVLDKMSAFWQKIFLTIGVLIAVFGMRLVFPLLIVAVTASLSPIEAFRLAVAHPDQYQADLVAAHPAIAAFGGMFLLMIFLDFVFEERQIRWLPAVETMLARIGKLDQLSVVIALGALLVVASTIAADPQVVTDLRGAPASSPTCWSTGSATCSQGRATAMQTMTTAMAGRGRPRPGCQRSGGPRPGCQRAVRGRWRCR